MKTVILCGGLGTRLREETEYKPKPMVEIGNHPILWHIMKLYSHYGFYRFIICLGYKGHMIKDYFLNYRMQGIDFTINTRSGNVVEHQVNNEAWEVTLVDTGLDCYTGGRVARALKYVDTDTFLMTYGDGVSDVNIGQLLDFHKSHGKLATLTGVNVSSRFGNLGMLAKWCLTRAWLANANRTTGCAKSHLPAVRCLPSLRRADRMGTRWRQTRPS